MKMWLLINYFLIANNFVYAKLDPKFDKPLEDVNKITLLGLKNIEEKCTNNIPEYCFLLGKYYEFKKRNLKALEFYSKSCGLRLGHGCFIGALFLEKIGQSNQSNDLYLMGCNLDKYNNGTENCIALGQKYKTQMDWDKAFYYFKKACDNKDSMGCILGAEICGYIKNPKEFENVELFRKGCDLDNAGSCYQLAQIQRNRGFHTEAKAAYKKACLGDIEDACDDYKDLNKGGISKDFNQITKPYWERIKSSIYRSFEQFFPLD